MDTTRLEREFANDVTAALQKRASGSISLVILAFLAVFGGGYLWASTAILDEVTSGQGTIIPSRQIQTVQSLEGGIVARIDVREGDRVAEGQPLIQIDDTSFSSQFGEISQKRFALQAARLRLEAEADGRQPDYSGSFGQQIPDALKRQEEAVARSRMAELDQQLSVLDSQKAQRTLEYEELKVRLDETRVTLNLIGEELELAEQLRQRGAFPQIEYIRIRRRLQEEKREEATLAASLPRAAAAIGETEATRASILAEHDAEIHTELAGVIGELVILGERIRGAEDRVDRTALRSPVDGIINSIPKTTIGAVVAPGETVVEIVPLDDTLLIEARIRPRDVAFIRPDQEASVKISAYDYTVYGDLKGRVERISADTIAAEDGETYYRVIVRTEESSLADPNGEPLPLIPGMVGQVDIRTGEKSVLDYLLKPIRRTQSEAFRER